MRVAAAAAALTAACTAQAAAQAGGEDVTWRIAGAGWGHGVGMSQYGARGMALHGAGYGAILGHFYTGTRLGRAEDRTVRVLVREAVSRVSFTGATRACGRRLREDRTYRATRSGDAVVLRTASGHRLAACGTRLRATGGATVVLAVKGRYRGALEVRPAGEHRLNAIDAVRLERYLRGVVGAEMPASWPAAALRAQAVVARTYALTTDVGGEGYALHDDQRSQVYRGVAGEAAATDAAVAVTAGRVVASGGLPVSTPFFSSSGGRTEDVENVWGGAPAVWLRSVADPRDSASPYHRWTVVLTQAEMQERLGDLVPGELVAIDVTARGASPRIVAADVVGTTGRTTVTGEQLRRRLRLRSTWASFERRPPLPPPPAAP